MEDIIVSMLCRFSRIILFFNDIIFNDIAQGKLWKVEEGRSARRRPSSPAATSSTEVQAGLRAYERIGSCRSAFPRTRLTCRSGSVLHHGAGAFTRSPLRGQRRNYHYRWLVIHRLPVSFRGGSRGTPEAACTVCRAPGPVKRST